jgi:hypothetical protein
MCVVARPDETFRGVIIAPRKGHTNGRFAAYLPPLSMCFNKEGSHDA